MDPMKIGKRVKALRTAKGWSEDELALECLLSTQQIYKIEEGLHVPAHQLSRVAESLDTTVARLSAGSK